MERDRVHFYSKTDMTSYHEMKKAIKVLDAFQEDKDYDIIDLIEFYQIKLYVDSEIFPLDWEEDKVQDAKDKVKLMWKGIVSFWQIINDDNIIEIFEQIERRQLEDSFWEITANLNCHKNISREKFAELLKEEDLFIDCILHQERIVKHFSQEIRKYLLTNVSAAELLLTEYEEKHDRDRKKLYFPKSLSLEDKEEILLKYINSDDPNINYTRLIINIRKSLQLDISDKTRLKATKLERKQNQEILEKGEPIKYGFELKFDKNQKQAIVRSRENDIDQYSYNMKLVTENHDPAVFVRYFTHLFGYLSRQRCIDLVSKNHEIDALEASLMASRNEYPESVSFLRKDHLSFYQMVKYEQVLISKNKPDIEHLLEHFIIDYLEKRYSIPKLRFNIPTSGIKYSERIRILLAEFDSLLRQYTLFCEEGEIDFELLEISSNPYAMHQIPSLVKNKYYYLNGKELQTDLFLIFSDQASLAYVKPFKDKHYGSLYNLLLNEEVVYGNFRKYQWNRLNILFDKGYLYVDHNGILKIKDDEKLSVLSQLYREEVLNYWRYTERQRGYMDELTTSGNLKAESTLLTKAEQSYVNYFLNKKEYTNGLDLRNKYLHGTNSPSEDEAWGVYYSLLRIIVLAVLKIDDDLRLNEIIKIQEDE